jgi:hypothetical protein
MGHKRRILHNPKFKHLKEQRFSSALPQEQATQVFETQEPTSNAELQEHLEAQPQETKIETPILDAAREEIEEAPKPKMTIKKSSPKSKTSTRKPRSRKTTAKRKSTKTEVE